MGSGLEKNIKHIVGKVLNGLNAVGHLASGLSS